MPSKGPVSSSGLMPPKGPVPSSGLMPPKSPVPSSGPVSSSGPMPPNGPPGARMGTADGARPIERAPSACPGQTAAGSRTGAGMTTTGQVALRMQDSLTEPSTVCRTRLWP